MRPQRPMKDFLRRLLRAVGLTVVAAVLLFEEWGWAPLAAAFAYLARLPVLRSIEAWIARLPPWAALGVLAVPALLLLPVKLLSLYLFGTGRVSSGVLLLVLAKVAGTALVARLFTLTQPALMQLAWFARWYPRWKKWKDQLIEQVHASAPWQAARRLKNAARARMRAWWSAFS